MLSKSVFLESENLLKQLQRLAKFVCDHQYISIADKGSGEMSGFCSAWLWDSVADFMVTEKFQEIGVDKKH